MNEVGSVESTLPVIQSYQKTVPRVYNGPYENTVKVENEIYDMVIYDYNGHIKSVLNKHTVEYIV